MCLIEIPFKGDTGRIIAKARTAINNAGGDLTGDGANGSFLIEKTFGTISGTYSIEDQNLKIEIKKRPFLISCDRIESILRANFDNTDL